jgi:Ca2+-binding EF-hand superfamily protein
MDKNKTGTLAKHDLESMTHVSLKNQYDIDWD